MVKLKRFDLLSKRENEIMLSLISGLTNRQIAEKFFVSISTVKTYVEKIYIKFNVHNRAELILYTLKNEIVCFE